MYTLTVAKDHTFFVGTAKVLVHNANCFKAGEELDRVFETVKGPVRVYSDIKIEGDTLVLDGLVVYPAASEGNLTGLLREVLAGRGELFADAKAQGFKFVRIIAHRAENSSSANPGHLIDRTIDLR